MLRTAMFQYVIIIHVTMVVPAQGESHPFNHFIIYLRSVTGRFILVKNYYNILCNEETENVTSSCLTRGIL